MAEFFAAILGKVAALLVAPIGRHVGYFFQFSGNVETLTKELEKLRNLEDDVKQEVEFAVNNVDNILITVETWLGRVDLVDDKAGSIINGKTRFPKGCFNNWCLNLKSRYVLSRQAKKRTREIIELQQEGKFPKVSLPAPPVLFMGSTSTTFNSREVFLEEIIKNLKNENISMIGICGMGGVGKTTMVEEVFKRVNKEKMFDDYAKTVVSQKADTAKVQNDIAEMLSLIIKENNPVLRASRLNQRLEGKRVIVILDDVWEEFDLQALGITLQDGQSKCKIVFTSRTQGLWMSLPSRRHEFLLHPLSGNELWNIFKEKIGDFLDDNPEFVTKAEKIVNECAGLPLASVTLARVLLGKGKRTWNDVLVKLRSVSGVQQKVYESIRLSYDHLGDEEAKSLFLLCSMFKEDSQIDVESLVNMGMGLRLFRGINRVEEVRDRVFALVEQLESCCLVSTESINYKAQYFVKVHDVVRDVSKSIASTSRGSLVIEHDVTDYNTPLKQSFDEHHTWISVISNFTVLPLMLPLPRLKLLRCSSDFLEISDSCFEGMVDLQVVDMTLGFDMSGFLTLKLPSSFQLLTSLRTLCLQYFRFTDFTPIKFLKSLEILCIVDTGIEEMPKEIGQLNKLRLLDMAKCENLKKASPGIISGLSNLEELYLGGLNIDWGAEETEKDRNPVHMEFELLFNLHILQIVIRDPQILPRTPVLGDLKKYQILVGGFKEKLRDESDFLKDSQNYERILSVCNVDLDKDLNLFVRNSEALLLKGKSAIRLVYELVRWASPSIRCLEIRKTDTPETLVDVTGITKAPFLVSNLESLTLHSLNKLHQVTNGPLVAENIANLKKLVVRDCKHLRNVLWVSNASDVLHLEKLHVSRCESMGEVICWERREEDSTRKLQFPKLVDLEIGGESLVCFCKGAKEVELHQLERLSLKCIDSIISISDENCVNSIFPPKVSFPGLVRMELYFLKNMKEIWCGKLKHGSFYNLTKLCIVECNSLEYVFSPYTAKYLVHLHTLDVYRCPSLKGIVNGPLVVGSLVNLREVRVCNRRNQLRNVFELPTTVDTMDLETLRISTFRSMDEVISWEGRAEDATSKLHFPKLKFLEIKNSRKHLDIENASSPICFCKSAMEIEFHQLFNLRLVDIPEVECLISIPSENPLKSIFPHKVSFPLLKKIVLHYLKNIKEIWCGKILGGSFYNLSELLIDKCDSLEYVFTPCMARYLLHRHCLRICNCKNLKEIVSAKEEVVMPQEYSISILPNLGNLIFNDLLVLERFCHTASYTIFPVLYNVEVLDCPEFNTFASGVVQTPILNHVQLHEGKTIWKGNLNSTIQRIHEDVSL